MNGLARRLVERSAAAVATVEAVFLVLVFVLLPLVMPGVTAQVQFVSSAVFQAVMLPVLAFMSDRIQRQGDAAQAERERIEAAHTERVDALLGRIEAMEHTILDRLETSATTSTWSPC